jgi:hypothetical protein
MQLGDKRTDADACDRHDDEDERKAEVVEVVDVDSRRDAERGHVGKAMPKSPPTTNAMPPTPSVRAATTRPRCRVTVGEAPLRRTSHPTSPPTIT